MAVAVLQGKGSFTIHLTLVRFHSSQITTMACNTYEESVKDRNLIKCNLCQTK